MTRIIKNRAVVEDSWSVLRLAEGETADTIDLPRGPVLVPLSVWHARKSALLAASSPAAPVGVWLAAGEGPESLADDLAQLSVIAVDFPKFTDGRGYSAARLLRETDLSIGDIAQQVGYENQSKFSNVFRDIFQVLPTEYRRQQSRDSKTEGRL